MGLFKVAHRYGMWVKRPPLLKICHTYSTLMKLGNYTLPKEDAKNYELRDTPFEFCWTRKLFCIKKYRYRLHFGIYFLIILTFFESSKSVLIKIVTILIMSEKMNILGLLKTKAFINKGQCVIISSHDVTNKISSRDSNYIVDVVMWPKFGNSSISMREVIITSIL